MRRAAVGHGRAVERAGLLSRAVYVERGTMQDERIVPLADA